MNAQPPTQHTPQTSTEPKPASASDKPLYPDSLRLGFRKGSGTRKPSVARNPKVAFAEVKASRVSRDP